MSLDSVQHAGTVRHAPPAGRDAELTVVSGAPRRHRIRLKRWSATRWDRLVVLAPAMLLLYLGWQHRWMSDDGLIFQRVVRQILAGHGPVYNVGDRAEAASSTLWPYLVAGVSWVTRLNPAAVAVYGGLLLTCTGFAIALDASRIVWRRRYAGPLLPGGALVVLGLTPFWDFATSGLESGLAFWWIGVTWRLLVRLRTATSLLTHRRLVAYALVFGMGPLIRPEFGMVSVCAAGLMAVTLRPLRWQRALSLTAALVVLPVGYEVFRAAYYGVLVPLPALAKEASGSDWTRGYQYLLDFVVPYWLVIPALLLALLVFLSRRHSRSSGQRPDLLLFSTPLIAALLLTVYVVRLGGDFMHARMLLYPMLLLLLPVMLLPAQQKTAALAFAALAGWACWCAVSPRPDVPTAGRPLGRSHEVVDERSYWISITHNAHPTSAGPFVKARGLSKVLGIARARANATGRGILAVIAPGSGRWEYLPLRRGLPWKVVVVFPVLGTAGATLSLDEAAFDPNGLAFPLAAHAALVRRGRAGHEKTLPVQYIIADLADPAAAAGPGIAGARATISCPMVQELQASTQAPLTLDRLWLNLRHSIGRTRVQIPVFAKPRRGC